MALSELAAIEAAYHALLSLDDAGRGRALRWLSDALDAPLPLAEMSLTAGSAPGSSDEAPAAPRAARATRRRASAGEVARKAKKNGATSATAARRRRRRTENAASSGGERAYRRMPDPDEVMAAYHQVGSVSGLAEHFGVPTHTVQGWARRLREKGHQIGRQS